MSHTLVQPVEEIFLVPGTDLAESQPYMAADTQNTSPTSAPQPPARSWELLLSEATKWTVFAAALVYFLGFLIWHDYLGRYGVSSIPFLQPEYVSAAVCYIIATAAIGLPSLFFASAYFDFRRAKVSLSASLLPVVTFVAYPVTVLLFFPGSAASGAVAGIDELGGPSTHCVGIGLIAITWLVARGRPPFKIPERYEVLKRVNYGALYWAVVLLIAFFRNPNIDKVFLFRALFAYIYPFWAVTTLFSSGGRDRFSRVLLPWLLGSWCLVVLFNVFTFAEYEFDRIPRRLGGGKPEQAYVVFAPNSTNLAAALQIPAATNAPVANGCFGPISVLLRSDKEIVFLNDAESIPPHNTTNVVSTLAPSRSSTFTANTAGRVVANLATNAVGTMTTSVVKGARKVGASQIRSDCVDALIFTEE